MLRRVDDAVDFNVSYITYQSTFGVQSGGSYWMGLDAMHGMASPCPASLRMEQLDVSGTEHFTYFKDCFVGPSSEDYVAKFMGRTSDVPDGIMNHCFSIWSNARSFSARDHGAYQIRAARGQGGWWWSNTVGRSALTIRFSRFMCPRSVIPNMAKVELVLLSRDGQVCNY